MVFIKFNLVVAKRSRKFAQKVAVERRIIRAKSNQPKVRLLEGIRLKMETMPEFREELINEQKDIRHSDNLSRETKDQKILQPLCTMYCDLHKIR